MMKMMTMLVVGVMVVMLVIPKKEWAFGVFKIWPSRQCFKELVGYLWIQAVILEHENQAQSWKHLHRHFHVAIWPLQLLTQIFGLQFASLRPQVMNIKPKPKNKDIARLCCNKKGSKIRFCCKTHKSSWQHKLCNKLKATYFSFCSHLL